jgi:hypothetical protein
MRKQVLALDTTHYRRHRIHIEDRNWAETNCYVDVWIELLHSWGFEAAAALAFTLGIDFEGDQWTFFKFPHADLHELFGLQVQELAIWRPLADHIDEQVALGRPVLVELDSFYLPDTVGTTYRREHVKSTVAVNEIDVANERLGYFHNQAYYALQGDDFAHILHAKEPQDPARLPPYVELVKRRNAHGHLAHDLVQTSLGLMRRHLKLLPLANPFEAFKSRFEADLRWLAGETLDMFHRYSFATLRQFGSCFELTATYLDWLRLHNVTGLHSAIRGFRELSTSAKTLQFQLARSMARKKPLDISTLDNMAKTWHESLADLQAGFSGK